MRLVDADKARECFGGDGVTGAVMQRMFDSLPTIDAVSVVRCRECKYYKPEEYFSPCVLPQGLECAKPDDFCSYGQRKEAHLDEAIEKYLKIIGSIHDGEGGQHV
ncbi:hypothetical protein [Flavonifractor plautii]|uniref:hypothetical protein n=1 Tax=Flavonifractor plautii TaxID=292800 RepID=UPI00233122A6|nr:hypothetical protein [Flavonifractor plautii]MDB7955314.1 hypothetical protein [Flavonifractor plautii]